MAINIVLAILVTSLATYISRFLGVITSKKVKENSKIFKWFNCLAYSTLSALLARIIIFPAGLFPKPPGTSIPDIDFSLFIFFISNKK